MNMNQIKHDYNEWYQLLLEAREIGLTVEDVIKWLKDHKIAISIK